MAKTNKILTLPGVFLKNELIKRLHWVLKIDSKVVMQEQIKSQTYLFYPLPFITVIDKKRSDLETTL